MTEDLNGQIAQCLFGWRWQADAQLWRDPEGLYCDAQAFRRRLPAYTIDPRATALVWQWVEEQAVPLLAVEYQYGEERITCVLQIAARGLVEGTGATWPEALCRAAVALAAALEGTP